MIAVLAPCLAGQIPPVASLNLDDFENFTVDASPSEALDSTTPTGIAMISGNAQSAVVNTSFAAPLIVQVNSSTGPVSNYTVTFSASGPVLLSSSSAITNSAGQAQVTVTAGAVAGAATVTASIPGYSVTSNWTVIPPGPTITAASFANAASGVAGFISPCSLATITGAGLDPTGAAGLFAQPVFGPLPTAADGISVTFGGNNAPLYSATLVNGQPQLTVQVPCEVTPAAGVPVTVNVGPAATVLNVPVLAAAPGIFQTLYADGVVRAVALRSDGSFVSLGGLAANPVRRGEIIRVYVTGLGPTVPAVGTGQIPEPGADLIGALATPIGVVSVGIGGVGATVISAHIAANMVGVFEVAFLVPTNASQGNNVALSVGVIPAGSTTAISSMTSILPIDDPSVSTAALAHSFTSPLTSQTLTAASFANAASGATGFISPCGIATITGAGLDPNGAASLFPPPVFGPLPTSASGLTVTFNNLLAPIYSLTWVDGQPQLMVQVPCEVTPGVSVVATVNAGGSSSTVALPVLAAAPGIFQVPYSDGTARAVAVRSDGSFVSLSNPVRLGEMVRVYVTGLGPTVPAVGTGQVDNPAADLFGAEAVAFGRVSVNITGAGDATVTTARLAANKIAVFVVGFVVPANAPQGSNIAFSVGIVPAGSSTVIDSAMSTIPIESVGSAPRISAVTNSASFATGAVSPGEIISIFAGGTNPIGPAAAVQLNNVTCPGSCSNLPTTMGGVQVVFLPQGVVAPLTYVSATQINCVVPYEVQGVANLQLEVKYLSQASNAFPLQTAVTAPGMFTLTGLGTGLAAMPQYDASGNYQGLNSAGNPASPGWYLTLYVTGEGTVSSTITGAVTSAVNVLPLLGPPSVLIDSLPATVSYYAEAYGFISGLMQVNVRIPSGVRANQADTISLSIGANSTQAGVTVQIQ